MALTCFELDIEADVAHIVLSRPEKRNSMISEFWEELPAVVGDIDANALARVIVISSQGPHFSSGLDVSAFADEEGQADPTAPREHTARQRAARFYANVKRMQKTFSCLEECRLPVIAAIQGGCIGGAVDLVTACDLRYASEDAYFTIFEINLALTADVGTFPRILKCLPDGLARELAFTGRRMAAAEAHGAGLVNQVLQSADAVREHALEVARQIAGKAPLAIYGSKRMLNYARDHSTADALDYVSLWNASMLHFDEVAEAMRANAEKRPGHFAPLPKLPGSDEPAD